MKPRPDYDEYLRSPQWSAVRQWALDRAGHACQVCNSPDSLDVHHRTYERLGHEWPRDLTVLCRTCHTLYHDRMQPPVPPPSALKQQAPRRLSPARKKLLDLDRRIQDLQRQIEAADDDDVKLELMARKSDLAAELRELDPRYWASATRRRPAIGAGG